jgi:hypothetical protein
MSSSEPPAPEPSEPSVPELVRELEKATQQVLSGAAPLPEPADISGILTIAVRLYAAQADSPGARVVPVDDSVSSTEVVVTATGLLRARDLNPFDLAVWFNRASATNQPKRAEQ